MSHVHQSTGRSHSVPGLCRTGYTFILMARSRAAPLFPPRPLHRFSRVHRRAAHPAPPRARARHHLSRASSRRSSSRRPTLPSPPSRQEHPGTKGRIRLVVGDITSPGLGLAASKAKELPKSLAGCFHLAAVYDLAVARDVGMRINVEGTKNVLEFLAGAPSLERLDYVSTAYVSGTAVGHVPRDGPRRRAELQELLRGDEVPRRGGRQGERPARGDLPAGHRRRQLEDGGDGEVRRPLLLAERDGRPPVARRLHQGGDGRRRGEPRARGLRPRGDRPPRGVGRRRREDVSPHGPAPVDGVRDRGDVREGAREVVRLRARAAPRREARSSRLR